MIFIMPNQYFYLVTIKPYKVDYFSKANLDSVFQTVKQKIRKGDWSSFVGYEFDKVNRIHLHTIVSRPSKIRKLRQVIDGCQVNFTIFPYEDYDKVVGYIRKDGLTETGANMLNLVYHLHMDEL